MVSLHKTCRLEVARLQKKGGPPKKGECFALDDFSLLVTLLLVTCSWLFRGPHLPRITVFVPFVWLFVSFRVFSWPPFWANFMCTCPRKVL